LASNYYKVKKMFLNSTQNEDLLLFNKLLYEDTPDEDMPDENMPDSHLMDTNNSKIDESTQNTQNTPKENRYCLIANELLDNNSIKLECNHVFNYIPLYNEVCQQKTKRILDNASLLLNEVKCPYCRNVSKQLLPYYKYYNVRSIRGVNAPAKYCMEINQCQHVCKNKKQCNVSACYTKHGYLCNKHIRYNMVSEALLETLDRTIYESYSKRKVAELKHILKQNICKQSGNKHELIERILLEKNDNIAWIE
jgi:hypothetical protein